MANTTKTSTVKKVATEADTNTNAALQAQIDELKKMLEAAQSALAMSAHQTVAPQPVVYSAPTNDVSVVYLSDSLGFAKISNIELNFNKYGEEFLLNRTQFDELVGKYHSWFDRGILAVSSKNVDVAAAKGLKTDKEYNLDPAKLEQIGNMTEKQLEDLWNEVTTKSHRESIVSFCKRKFIEGDEKYTSRGKIDLLNRLTDGAFSREQDELSGRYKIQPTEM